MFVAAFSGRTILMALAVLIAVVAQWFHCHWVFVSANMEMFAALWGGACGAQC